MHDKEIDEHQLSAHADLLKSVSQKCLVGEESGEESGSYFGGTPVVDDGFEWPVKNGHPLHFIGQLKCSAINLLPREDGSLLFFYDNRHGGYSARDIGHAVVIHQHGERLLTDADLPVCEVKSFFGLRKRLVRPTVFRKVPIAFGEGRSYPSLDRGLIDFDDDVADECYFEFLEKMRPPVQIGGFPAAIQSDAMEKDCVRAHDLGEPSDWKLLLQLFEICDMQWGDAGALYWFIHKDDLSESRFDRVWMVSQCH